MIVPRAVLFDLDDTLYPERAFVDGGFRAVGGLLEPHLSQPGRKIARRLRELHDRDGRGRLFDTLLAELGHPDDPDLVLAAVLAYRTHRPRLRPFPEVVETIDRLRAAGIATGLVSDGLSAVQDRKVKALSAIARRLDVVVLTDELGADYAKPSPVAFRVACRLLKVRPESVVYVANDPRKDFAGARRAGMATIRTGRLPDEGGTTIVVPPDGADADVVVDGFAAVGRLLLGEPPMASHPERHTGT